MRKACANSSSHSPREVRSSTCWRSNRASTRCAAIRGSARWQIGTDWLRKLNSLLLLRLEVPGPAAPASGNRIGVIHRLAVCTDLEVASVTDAGDDRLRWRRHPRKCDHPATHADGRSGTGTDIGSAMLIFRRNEVVADQSG